MAFVFISIIGDFIHPPNFRPNILVLRDYFFVVVVVVVVGHLSVKFNY